MFIRLIERANRGKIKYFISFLIFNEEENETTPTALTYPGCVGGLLMSYQSIFIKQITNKNNIVI